MSQRKSTLPASLPFEARPTRVGANALLPGLLARLGVDVASVFAKAGVGNDCLDNPDATIAMADLARFTEAAIAASRRPDLGLLIGELAGAHYVGPLLDRLALEKDLRAALEMLVVLLPINTRAAVARLLVDDDQAVFELAISHPFGAVAAAFDDAIVSIVCATIRALMGGAWRPSRVLLTHQATTTPAHYRRVFGAPTRFNAAVSAIVFPAADLQRPPAILARDSNATAAAKLEAALSRLGLDFEDRVRAVVREHLADPALTLRRVATLTATAPRSLNRKLASRGTSFAELLRQTRYATACQLLASADMPLGTVATTIGYADQAVFSRAFRRWAGMSPRQWRQQQRGRAG